jgi:hypothetical protein
MQKWIKIFLILNLFIACKSYKNTLSTSFEPSSQKVQNNYFYQPNQEYVYRANIKISDKDLSGILAIKPINENTTRLALNTDFGNKLLDFQYQNDQLEIKYLSPDLDNFFIKKVLEETFKYLVKRDYQSLEKTILNNQNIYFCKNNGKQQLLYFEIKTDKLTKIEVTNARKVKIVYDFNTENNNFANNLIIKNIPYNISIELEHFKE